MGFPAPGLPRFVSGFRRALPLCGYLQSRKAAAPGVSFVDSLPVCHNRHPLAQGLAGCRDAQDSWLFYGFKLTSSQRPSRTALLRLPGNAATAAVSCHGFSASSSATMAMFPACPRRSTTKRPA